MKKSAGIDDIPMGLGKKIFATTDAPTAMRIDKNQKILITFNVGTLSNQKMVFAFASH